MPATGPARGTVRAVFRRGTGPRRHREVHGLGRQPHVGGGGPAALPRSCRTRVLGLRCTGDRSVPSDRFRFLRERLGEVFVAVELEDSAANPAAVMRKPHPVLTEHLVDEPGGPTRQAVDRVLDLFRRRLLTTARAPTRRGPSPDVHSPWSYVLVT